MLIVDKQNGAKCRGARARRRGNLFRLCPLQVKQKRPVFRALCLLVGFSGLRMRS